MIQGQTLRITISSNGIHTSQRLNFCIAKCSLSRNRDTLIPLYTYLYSLSVVKLILCHWSDICSSLISVIIHKNYVDNFLVLLDGDQWVLVVLNKQLLDPLQLLVCSQVSFSTTVWRHQKDRKFWYAPGGRSAGLSLDLEVFYLGFIWRYLE